MRRRFLILLALALAAIPACSDSFGPGRRPIPAEPTQDTLFDFRTAELRQPTAFDILSFRPVRVDLTSGWDFLFRIPAGGSPELAPRSDIIGEFSTAGLQETDRSFESITEAPESGYETESPTPISQGEVLLAVSRQNPSLGISCRLFMKMEILSIDTERGRLVFRHLGNPNCGRRDLSPSEDDDG